MALSYCWGTDENYKTTEAMIPSMEMGFPLLCLPKTVQDAIYIARKLHIRHIWVDALCIIQDSPNDWLTESSSMSTVYQNAFLTLAASSANSASSGFLQDYDTKSSRNTFSLPWVNDDGSLSEAKARIIPVHHWPTRYALDNRAWALQEALLSTRLLMFTPREIRWECKETAGCECRPSTQHAYQQTSPFNLQTSQEAGAYWRNIVKGYTQRAMRNPQDKLPAIAGIARILQPLLGPNYIAGLWRNTLMWDLTWKTSGAWNPTPKPSEEYIAPTFSWASMTTAVDYEYTEFNDFVEKGDVLNAQSSQSSVPGQLAFGRVSSGSLQLRGYLYHTKFDGLEEGENSYPWETVRNIRLAGVNRRFFPDVMIDSFTFINSKGQSAVAVSRLRPGYTLNRWTIGLPVTVFYLGYVSIEGDQVKQIFLCLGRSPQNPEFYERLGCIAFDNSRRPDFPIREWEAETITLV